MCFVCIAIYIYILNKPFPSLPRKKKKKIIFENFCLDDLLFYQDLALFFFFFQNCCKKVYYCNHVRSCLPINNASTLRSMMVSRYNNHKRSTHTFFFFSFWHYDLYFSLEFSSQELLWIWCVAIFMVKVVVVLIIISLLCNWMVECDTWTVKGLKIEREIGVLTGFIFELMSTLFKIKN